MAAGLLWLRCAVVELSGVDEAPNLGEERVNHVRRMQFLLLPEILSIVRRRRTVIRPDLRPDILRIF